MKTYRFTSSGVFVHGQPLRLKGLRNEPEQFPNPDRVAFSILVDCVGDGSALLHGREFQREIVNHCTVGTEITSDEVQEWNDYMCRVGASVQWAGWEAQDTEPTAIRETYLHMPRLLRVQRSVAKESQSLNPRGVT